VLNLKFGSTILSGAMLALSAGVAMAGAPPAPLPLAGAFGPWGLVAAGVGYAGYRLYKRTKG
jgi:hypothetical protein